MWIPLSTHTSEQQQPKGNNLPITAESKVLLRYRETEQYEVHFHTFSGTEQLYVHKLHKYIHTYCGQYTEEPVHYN
jgi:hypothetical protein